MALTPQQKAQLETINKLPTGNKTTRNFVAVIDCESDMPSFLELVQLKLFMVFRLMNMCDKEFVEKILNQNLPVLYGCEPLFLKKKNEEWKGLYNSKVFNGKYLLDVLNMFLDYEDPEELLDWIEFCC